MVNMGYVAYYKSNFRYVQWVMRLENDNIFIKQDTTI
jgi:hypothetical protein